MKKFILTIFLSLSLLGVGSLATPVNSYAQSNDENFELTVAVKNPLGDKKEFKDILSAVLKAIMEIVLPIVIVMVIYSGFLYVVARGKPEAIEKAHKTLTWTLIGAAILLGAQLIATVLVDTISNIGKDAGVSTSGRTGSNNVVVNNSGSNGSGLVNNNPVDPGSSSGVVSPSGNTTVVSNTTSGANNAGTGFSNGTNVSGSSNTGNQNVSSTPVTTTKYYVNAVSGANLRSAPNLTSSYKTQAYGTVLDVSGETSGFFNVYNSSGTDIIGYISKSLLTQGSKAPTQTTGGSSSSQSNLGAISVKSQYPFSGVTRTYLNVEVLKTFNPWGGYLSFECKDQNNNMFSSPNITRTNLTTISKGTISSLELDITPAGVYTCKAFYWNSSSGTDKRYTTNSVKITVK
jgi:hypothetical protein